MLKSKRHCALGSKSRFKASWLPTAPLPPMKSWQPESRIVSARRSGTVNKRRFRRIVFNPRIVPGHRTILRPNSKMAQVLAVVMDRAALRAVEATRVEVPLRAGVTRDAVGAIKISPSI